jgi:transcription elongation factor Elf1
MAKISNCPVCGRIPTYMAMTFTSGSRRHTVSCSGLGSHSSIRTEAKSTKKLAVDTWNTIVSDVKAKEVANG